MKLGIDALIKAALARGAVLSGGSAGFISLCNGGHSDSMEPDSYKNPPGPFLNPAQSAEQMANWAYFRRADIPRRRVAATPRLPRGYSAETSRGRDADLSEEAGARLRYPAFETLGNPNSFYRRDKLHLSSEGYALWDQWATLALGDSSGCAVRAKIQRGHDASTRPHHRCVRWLGGACDDESAGSDDKPTPRPTTKGNSDGAGITRASSLAAAAVAVLAVA